MKTYFGRQQVSVLTAHSCKTSVWIFAERYRQVVTVSNHVVCRQYDVLTFFCLPVLIDRQVVKEATAQYGKAPAAAGGRGGARKVINVHTKKGIRHGTVEYTVAWCTLS